MYKQDNAPAKKVPGARSRPLPRSRCLQPSVSLFQLAESDLGPTLELGVVMQCVHAATCCSRLQVKPGSYSGCTALHLKRLEEVRLLADCCGW